MIEGFQIHLLPCTFHDSLIESRKGRTTNVLPKASKGREDMRGEAGPNYWKNVTYIKFLEIVGRFSIRSWKRWLSRVTFCTDVHGYSNWLRITVEKWNKFNSPWSTSWLTASNNLFLGNRIETTNQVITYRTRVMSEETSSKYRCRRAQMARVFNCLMICGHICCTMESMARLTTLSMSENNWSMWQSMWDLWSTVFCVSEQRNHRVKQLINENPMDTASENRAATPKK